MDPRCENLAHTRLRFRTERRASDGLPPGFADRGDLFLASEDRVLGDRGALKKHFLVVGHPVAIRIRRCIAWGKRVVRVLRSLQSEPEVVDAVPVRAEAVKRRISHGGVIRGDLLVGGKNYGILRFWQMIRGGGQFRLAQVLLSLRHSSAGNSLPPKRGRRGLIVS